MFCELASAGSVYRWVDAKGRVHYGDPSSAQAGAVEVKPGGATAPSIQPPRPALVSAPECEDRRRQLNRYREAGQITETDALGQQHEYTDAQRLELIRIAEQKVQQACTKPQS